MDSTITATLNIVKSENISGSESHKPSLLSRKTSPDVCDSETAKDSGTEKKQEEKDIEECNHHREEEEDLGFDANSYQAETVDFPESPQHLKLLNQKTREAQGLGPDDDDLTQNLHKKYSVQSTDEQLSRQGSKLVL